jgi:LCP family protein required for cell wall assembly
LGPALDTPIPTATSAPQAVPTGTSEPQAQEAQPDARAISVPIVAANEVCGETAVWNVLVLGSDAADLYYPQGSDLTRIVRVDFPNKQVSMFAFTRDLWVDTLNLGFTNPTINATKLGLVYHEARLRSTKTDPKEIMLEGVNASAKVLAQNFSVNSDHYVAIDVSQIPAMIDAIGGLPINIPANFTDPLTNMAFTAGQQTLNGERAAVYARAFTGSDFERIQRDNLVLEALRQRLQDPAIWVRLPQLFVQFQDVVLTDLSPEQVNNLICLLSEVSSESIIQDGVRAEWTTSGQEGSLLWDRTQVLDRLRELGIIP